MATAAHGPVRVRYAPSPTGILHIGGARTALYNWLIARKTGGQFVLRIEDTDQERYVEGGVEGLMQALRWLGLHWDEGPDIGGPYGPYVQSQRLPIYQAHIQPLLASGRAYESFYSKEEIDQIREDVGESNVVQFNYRLRAMPEAEKRRRREAGVTPAILLCVPDEGETVTYDEIRGAIRTPNRSMRDPVLIKSDGFPTYHFAAMVDDHLMQISHVIRSQEWLPSHALHALILDALGFAPPKFYHASVFLNPEGKGKMSKRYGNRLTFVQNFIEDGFLPEAVVNWVALMGWAETGGDKEVYTPQELIDAFSLERLRPSPVKVNYDKAEWVNGVHIRALRPVDLARRLVPVMRKAGYEVSVDDLLPLVPLIQERLALLTEATELLDFFFVTPPEPAIEDLVPKRLTPETTRAALQAARDLLAELEPFDAQTLDTALRGLAEARGLKAGDLLTPIRGAVSSKTVTPPLFGTIENLGRATTLERIDRAIRVLA